MARLIHSEQAERMHGTAFTDKVREIGKRLRIDPDWIMAVMKSESGFDHTVKNPYSTASGLIQFIESTANQMGTTAEALRSMSALRQLDYVEMYYQAAQNVYGRINKPFELYMATFYPVGLDKPMGFVLGSEQSPSMVAKITAQNPGMDTNSDGQITKREFRDWVDRRGVFNGIGIKPLPITMAVLGTGAVATGIIYRNEIKSLFT